jgi:hypothetical protein
MQGAGEESKKNKFVQNLQVIRQETRDFKMQERRSRGQTTGVRYCSVQQRWKV